MKSKFVHRMLVLLGWLLLAASCAMFAYAAYAVTQGVVYIASRSTAALVQFDKSPFAFTISILIYLFGGGIFLWIAWGLLPRRKQ